MTIGRRQVVGWGALGLGAVALDGCSGFPWGRTAPTASPDEVDRLLSELDHVVHQLKKLEPDPASFGIKRRGPEVAQGSAMCIRMLTSLCFMGTYRDVPEALWRDPRVEQRLAETLPKIHATVTSARDLLVSVTDEQGSAIEKALKDDPNLTMRIMERVDDYAKQCHVPLEQRAYLRTATAQLAGRFRYEGSKEVTAKLTAKYDRTLASRKNELGLQAEVEPGGGDQKAPQPAPVRARFRTRSPANEVHVATCSVESKVTLDGAERQVLLDWDEFRCPPTSAVKLSDDHPPVHGTVHTEPGEGGLNVVTVTLYPPAGVNADDALTAAVTSIAEQLQRLLVPSGRAAEAHAAASSSASSSSLTSPFSGQTCVTTADCGPLRCIDQRCRNPYGTSSPPVSSSRLGSVGESCRDKDDCEGPLVCTQSVCKNEDESSSAKLITTTGKIAKWGAILLIPPICAIGVLVLLTCLFMVIVAGCMYAGGD